MKQRGRWVKAFADEDAVRIAVKGVEAVCYEYAPDLVVVVSGFFVPADLYGLMRARGSPVVLLCTESPYEDDRAVNRRCWYIGHGYDPVLHRPGPSDPDAASDFVFVGTGYPSRVEFLEQVDWTGIDVALAGNWQSLDVASPLRKFLAHDIADCCPNDQAVILYRSTKVSANLYRRETTEGGTPDGWAMSPREVELAATGCFFLTEPRGENLEVLPMVPTFTSPLEFEERLRWYLARPDERAGIVSDARAAVADRTFESNARQLLRLAGI
jgi:spore maturation protein CgeB